MKKIIYLLLLITGFANAEIVNIPDANFKAKLLQASTSNNGFPIALDINNNPIVIDINGDNEIQFSEALLVYRLTVRTSNIFNLTGVEAFTNLTYLNFDFNPITSFNVNISGLTNLETISAYNCPQLSSVNTGVLSGLKTLQFFGNELNSLNLSQYPNLEQLIVNDNMLTDLNLSSVPNLLFLKCEDNFLTSLDLSSVPNLQNLSCENNSFSILNLEPVPNLTSISYGNNGLATVNINELVNLSSLYFYGGIQSSIDVSNLTNLSTITFQNTNLTFIDLSNNPNVGGEFFINNNINLQSINIKNGNNDANIYFSGSNPNLTFICCDDAEQNSIQSNLINLGMSTTVSNTYCSFTPGGNYNTITGNIKFDSNSDGCDVLDLPQPNIRLDINDGTNQGATFTTNSGNYNFYTDAGSFTLIPNVENPNWFIFSPTTATIPFADNNNNIVTQNFCVNANGMHEDAEIAIAPITPARPGFDATYLVTYKNKGNTIISSQLALSYDDAVLDYVSSTIAPTSQFIGVLLYDYVNLQPFESRSFQITLNVNSPTETPAVNIGDELQFSVEINTIVPDENPADNLFTYNQTVVGSYDPNDITCLQGNSVPASEIGEYLHYVINFENTGTFFAENIVVRTEIDPTKFDINSLQMLSTSHNAYIKITGNTVEFIFENILLDTGGHGNVLLKVRSKNNLQQGDTVSKIANIYFDYNAPIETNLENTTFQALSNTGFEVDNSVAIYPNPTNAIININCNNTIKSVQLYDVQGRLLQTQITNSVQSTMDISDKSNGIYFIKVTSEKGTKAEKIIKE